MSQNAKITELRRQRHTLATAQKIATMHDWAKLPDLLDAAVDDINEQIQILEEEDIARRQRNR